MTAFAITEAGGRAVAIDAPLPEPTGHEVLLAVTHSGVCHTDMHLRDGGYDLGRRGFLDMTTRGMTYPLVAGHEIVGEVVAVGADVTTVKPGDVRLVYPWLGCGDCTACHDDRENYCTNGRMLGVQRPGGFASQVHVPHERYLLDVTGIDPARAATLACSGLTSYSAVTKALPADPSTAVAVIGAGGLGLMAVAALRALGHETITVLDVNADRLRTARDMGATVTIDTTTAITPDAIMQHTGGPVEAVLDFVNNSDTAELAFSILAKGGTQVAVGLFGGEARISTALLAMKCLTVQGSFVGTLAELHELIALAQGGSLPEAPITRAELGADALNESLDALAAGTVRGRVVLTRR
ncbi:alcohol dehydrogenase [Ornithinimicrobium cryptoxanthini]|uniref:alcohol dehydrogenase n=1 Tax=Ornithinimicrobium cryptoxanthini TaxID=2934161 RepID=UPI00211779DC|nr:alcohol dehydrogenase [Ornithinimicrobium cryptoxanthini]